MLFKRRLDASDYNRMLNACRYFADARREAGEEDRAESVESAIACVRRYSFVQAEDLDPEDQEATPTSVVCQMDQRDIPWLWEVADVSDDGARQAGYEKDYASELLEKRKRYIRERKAEEAREREERDEQIRSAWKRFRAEQGGRASKRAFTDALPDRLGMSLCYGTVCKVLKGL